MIEGITCTVSSDELLTAFKLVSPAVARKSSMPVLECMLFAFDASTQTLTLSATNLECGITRSMPAKGAQSFAVCLPWKWAKEQKRKNLGEQVELTFLPWSHKMFVCGVGNQTVDGISRDEYPVLLKAPATATRFTLPDAVMQAIVTTAPFAETGGVRPVIEGVHVHKLMQHVVVEAADGFRMHRELFEVDTPKFEVLIPREAVITKNNAHGPLSTLVSLLDVDEWPIALGNDGRLHITFPRTTFVTRLIEGRYPDVQRIIPTIDSGVRGVFDRGAFLAELERILPAAKANNDIARFEVIGDKDCRLWVQVSQANGKGDVVAETTLKAHADVVVQPNGTDMMKWYGNVNYWMQLLRAIGTEYVSFAYKGSPYPALFQPVGEDHVVQHVLMPMTTRV